jgi:hypothetical protein
MNTTISVAKLPSSVLRGFASALAVAALSASPRGARAQELHPQAIAADPERPPRPPDRPKPTRWYGYQGALLDVASVGLLVGAAATWKLCLGGLFDGNASSSSSSCDNGTSYALATASLAFYGLGAPVVHAAHGHWDKAGLSLGLRAAPMLLWLPFSANGRDAASIAGMFAIGALFVMIIDCVGLGREEIEPASSGLRVSAAIDSRTHGGVLLVGNAF